MTLPFFSNFFSFAKSVTYQNDDRQHIMARSVTLWLAYLFNVKSFRYNN